MKVAAYTDFPVFFCLAFKKLDFTEAHKQKKKKVPFT